MRVRNLFVLIFSILIISACDSGYEQFEEGYSLKRIESKGGKTPGDKDALMVHLKIELEDSLIVNSKDLYPMGRRLGMNNMWPDFKNVLATIGEGDSVRIKMGLPEYAKLEGRTSALIDSTLMVTMSMRVIGIGNESSIIERMVNEQLAYENEAIEKYLINNNLEAERTEEGVYYIISQEGEGDFVSLDDDVLSRFTIKLLNGKVLGTTDEDVAKANGLHTESRDYSPYEFNLSKPRTLEGWLQVVPKFKEGSKGQMIIPSRFAYGSRGAAGVIPPNATLIYDLEIIEIK